MSVKCTKAKWVEHLTATYGELVYRKHGATWLYYSKDILDKLFGEPTHVGSWQSGEGWEFT